VAEHRAKLLPSAPDKPAVTVTELITMVGCLSTMSTNELTAFGTVKIAILDVSGKAIYLSKELVQAFMPPVEGFVK
jgi:hypothetical protein